MTEQIGFIGNAKMTTEPEAPQVVRVFVQPATTVTRPVYPINSYPTASGPQQIIYVQPQPQIVLYAPPASQAIYAQPQIVQSQPQVLPIYAQPASQPTQVVMVPTPVLQSVGSLSTSDGAQPSATQAGPDPTVKTGGDKPPKNAVSRLFHRVMDLDSLRPLIETEFKLKSVWSKGLLLRAIITTFILSMVDVVTDLAVLIKFAPPGNCLRLIYEADDRMPEYRAIIAMLSVSCGSALLNTILLKYVYAVKAMKKHKLSLWQAIKYVALVTHLKTSMSYSSCFNRYHWLRVLVTLLEDVLQVVAGLMIFEALRVPDTTTQWSLIVSLCSISYVLSGTCVWPCVNPSGRKPKCKRPVRFAGRCCCCSCCGCCLIWCLFIGGLSAEFLWKGFDDRKFQVADIEYHILSDSVSPPDFTGYRTHYRANLSLSYHYGIRRGDEGSGRHGTEECQCIDANGLQLSATQLEFIKKGGATALAGTITAPAICVNIFNGALYAVIDYDADKIYYDADTIPIEYYCVRGDVALKSRNEMNLETDVKNVLRYPTSLVPAYVDTDVAVNEFVIEYTWTSLLSC